MVACIPWVLNFAVRKQQYNLLKGVSYYYFDVSSLFGFLTIIDLRSLDLQLGSFTLRQIKAATKNFDIANKIGEGGFGSVYKVLCMGSLIHIH